MSTIDDRIVALGITAGEDIAQLAASIGAAGPQKRREAIVALTDPSRTAEERASVAPLFELVALIDMYGAGEVIAAIERAGARRQRERAWKW